MLTANVRFRLYTEKDIDFAVKEVKRMAKDHKARCVQLSPFPSDLGLPDFQEVHKYRTDPRKKDTKLLLQK